MESQRIGLSLRYKLLAVLTVLPLLSLASYLLMATQLFEKDKIAYVFDSSVAVSRFLANQIQVEFDAYLNAVKPVVERYDYDNQQFSSLSNDLFLKQNRVDVLLLFQRKSDGSYLKLGELKKSSEFENSFLNQSRLVEQLRARAVKHRVVLENFPASERHVAIAYMLGEAADPNHLVMLSLYRSEDLVESFLNATLYKSFLIGDGGQILMAPSVMGGALKDVQIQPLFEPVLASRTPEGTAEVKTERSKSLLLSYSKVGVGGLAVASLVDKTEALKAVDLMVSKSLLFFIALLSGTVLISVFASIQLTSTLRELYEATKKIAQGQFDIRIKSRSRDEVGGLAESFNWMAGEVSRLLSETAEKARMENELATVKTVQETLFPEPENKFGPFNIVGHFEPASECGGDWWSYSRVENRLYLWIGDATGHGAPAALITSAARSAAAIIEALPEMSTAKALEVMNRAIHETSKGKIMMTFFLGCIDLEKNVLTYSNASHDPPYLIRRKEGKKLSKRDLLPLMDEVGPRLGDRAGSTYTEVSLELEPGDAILFYTDGIIDLNNQEGEAWGERQFVKTLVKAVDEGATTQDKMEKLKVEIHNYRQDSQLIDDITLFMCEYEKAS